VIERKPALTNYAFTKHAEIVIAQLCYFGAPCGERMLANMTSESTNDFRKLTLKELEAVSGGQSDERGRIFHTRMPPPGLAVLMAGLGAAVLGVGGGQK
jgi:hypothetical protein